MIVSATNSSHQGTYITMKSASGRDRQEDGALQHRQRWTVLVTNSKKKADGSATNTQTHRYMC